MPTLTRCEVSQFVFQRGRSSCWIGAWVPSIASGEPGAIRVLRVAQTLADLAGLEAVGEEQISEALLLGGGKRG